MSTPSTAMQQLYQQLILDHAREKHGFGDLAAPTGTSRQYNPLCGDEVTLKIEVAQGAVAHVAWTGDGCSISQASTSVLHDLVTGRPVSEALEVLATFRDLVRSRGQVEPDEELLGDAVAFAGVGRHANRVKCAMLGWTALEDALLQSGTQGAGGEGDE
ncbi:Fe-S cluster assembly sulfur transfer protein SufU [Spongisporangium articulatum]|uniref:Fe-S cluster assembly sulfur transfer protein SufU n=1 Tax=Spongisporangium articulatum TaxID=3362603 RepID=A0ABW8AT04_9ACTN